MAKENKNSIVAEERDGIISRAIKVAAYPISGLVGFLYTKNYVHSEFYDNIKETALNKERMARDAKVAEMFPPPGVTKDIKNDLSQLHKEYWATTTQRFEEAGYHNTWDYLKGLHANQKWEAATTFLTAAGITLGVLLTVAENKQLRSLLAYKEAEESSKRSSAR